MTRERLARACFISERALLAIEDGRTKDMLVSTLERLADALKLSTDKILGRTG